MRTAEKKTTAAKTTTALEELKELLGDRLSTATAVCDHHGRGESWHMSQAPDGVAFAQSTEEVSEIVKICARHGLPVIPYGTGTSLEGHVAALQGGITIDVSQMNQVLRVNVEDLDCTVQAGVTRKQLNEYIRDTGLFFPIDPGADASIGGMTATRASGTNAVRYGTMRENVLSVTAVLPDGTIMKSGGRARKSSAGYDLTRLMVGSEGTFGVVTEITLRLYGIPEAVSAGVIAFDDIEGAVNTVILTIQSGIGVARMELLDDVQLDAINKYSGLDYPVKPTLFMEFHGSEAGVIEQAETFKAISDEFGGGEFRWSTKTEDRNKLWQARHDAAYACKALRPNCEIWATDVCVPISRLTECIVETKADVDASNLIAPLVGHVGDGNFHLAFVLEKGNAEELAEAEALNAKLIQRALAMEGTCTGEHGVGYGKIKYLNTELGGPAVNMMRVLKRAIDPQNIMNPGKVVSLN